MRFDHPYKLWSKNINTWCFFIMKANIILPIEMGGHACNLLECFREYIGNVVVLNERVVACVLLFEGASL